MDQQNDPLFAGCYPTGIVYADKRREKNGDYVRVGYISYKTLKLELEPKCPKDLTDRIRAAHAELMRKRGQPFHIAGNMTIKLGVEWLIGKAVMLTEHTSVVRKCWNLRGTVKEHRVSREPHRDVDEYYVLFDTPVENLKGLWLSEELFREV